MHKLGIHARAGGGEGLKHRRSFEREVGEHAGGRVRCLPPRLSAFHHQDGDAALAQRDREREPNDPAADDDHVPGLHQNIVVELKAALVLRTATTVVGKRALGSTDRP